MRYKDGTKETLNIFILYRTISIIVLTIVYIITWNNEITYSKLFIVLGMILSSTTGTFLYKNNYLNNNIIITTIILEGIAYSVFIILSGGFSSPYLWYYINLLIIIMALKPFRKHSKLMYIMLMILMLTSVLISYIVGFVNGFGVASYSDINTGIAFVIVSAGFYLLLKTNDKLIQEREKLYKLNQSLKKSKNISDYALKHAMNVYDSLNLFSISDPQRVMDELNSTLYKAIAKKGCALFKIDILSNIEMCSHEGILNEDESIMAEFIVKKVKTKEDNTLPSDLKIGNKEYNIIYIRELSNILAILFITKDIGKQVEPYYGVEGKFYLTFVKIIMQELDNQSMIESYIKCEEQNRIANEIHDTVIQKLFSISLNMSYLEENIGEITKEEEITMLQNIIKSTNSAMKTLREAIYGINWDEDETLEYKVTTYIEETVDMNNTNISLNLNSEVNFLTSNKKTALYRIICESINNAIRHGDATKINIDVNVQNGFVTGCIRDNGTGFDKDIISKDSKGINNMYMITGILKGSLDINSERDKGTEIICKMPI